MEDQVRIIRILEYNGPRSWVERTLGQSIQGTKVIGVDSSIRAVTLGSFPDIVNRNDKSPEHPRSEATES